MVGYYRAREVYTSSLMGLLGGGTGFFCRELGLDCSVSQAQIFAILKSI